MRITIIVDDADSTAATEAAQTISRTFVRAGSTQDVASSESTARPSAAVDGTDADAGEAPRLDFGGSSSSAPSPIGDDGSAVSAPSPRPARPSAPDPIDESVGAAPEHRGD